MFIFLLAIVAAGGFFSAPAPSAQADTETIQHATFEWGINEVQQSRAPNGACGPFSAGTDPGYRSRDGNVAIIKRLSDGKPVFVNEATSCSSVEGSLLNQRVLFTEGSGTRDTETGATTIQWTGGFRIEAYGGLASWTMSNPKLVLNADGTGEVLATLAHAGGAAVTENIVVANLSGIDVGSTSGFTATPLFTHVEYFPLLDGVRLTTSAISDNAKSTFPGTWGSWPESMVDFHYAITGLSSYWHTSDASTDLNQKKPPYPITVNYDGGVPPLLPDFTTLPASQTVVQGANATLEVAAVGDPVDGALSYLWESRTPGSEWATIEGATTATLRINSIQAAQWDGVDVRAIVINGAGERASPPATLTVPTVQAPVFTSQPSEQLMIAGYAGNGNMSVRASGVPEPTYQWQQSSDGTTWQNLDVTTSRTLSLNTFSAADNGTFVRAVASNGIGHPAVSNSARLNVLVPDGNTPQLMFSPYVVDPTVRTTARVAGTGFEVALDATTGIRVCAYEVGVWSPGQPKPADGFSCLTYQAVTLRNQGGMFRSGDIILNATRFEPGKQYGYAAFAVDPDDRSMDAWVPINFIALDEPTPIEDVIPDPADIDASTPPVTQVMSDGGTISLQQSSTILVAATFNDPSSGKGKALLAKYVDGWTPSGTVIASGDAIYDVHFAPTDSTGPNATLTVNFTHLAPNKALTYWDGASWREVRSIDGELVRSNAGGNATVVFGSTSTPTLLELSGTPFGTEAPGGSEPGESSASQTITTSVVATGALSISVSGTEVTLPTPVLNGEGDALVSSGALNPVTVTDLRSANPGWNLNGQVSDFVSGSDSFSGNSLGWTPNVVSQSEAQNVVAGSEVAPGGSLGSGAGLASAGAGEGRGTAVVGAGLELSVPTNTPAGTYSATLTVTVI